MKTAFLFSGQGAQYTGMGTDLCAHYPRALEVYRQASDAFGFDVLRLSAEGTPGELAKTSVSQPLIFTLSLAVLAELTARGLRPSAVAGFSLGECSALVCAGAMTAETGFAVIRERSQAMQRAADATESAMAAVLGADGETIERACVKASAEDGYAAPVNYNYPGQTVIAGETAAVDRACALLSSGGARVVRLAVNAAFHSRLMEHAAQAFYDKIKDFSFASPTLPVYSNLTGDIDAVASVPDYLRAQMSHPVRFVDEMNAISRDGFDTFVELGPGKTLCGFIKKGIRGAHAYRAEDGATLETCLKNLI